MSSLVIGATVLVIGETVSSDATMVRVLVASGVGEVCILSREEAKQVDAERARDDSDGRSHCESGTATAFPASPRASTMCSTRRASRPRVACAFRSK